MGFFLILFGLFSGSLLAVLVGMLGARRNIGFGWAFLLSIIFTPLLGLIFVLISDPKPVGEVKYGCLGTTLGYFGLFVLLMLLFGVLSLLAMTLIGTL